MWPFSKKREIVDLTPLRNRVQTTKDNVDLTPNATPYPVSDNDSSGLGFLGNFASSGEPSSSTSSPSNSNPLLQSQDLKVKVEDMEYKVDSMSRRINALIDRIDLVEKKVDRNNRLS